MHPKDLAAKYEVKVFDSPSAAEAAGFRLGQRLSPRNVWNRDSAASAILFDLLGKLALIHHSSLITHHSNICIR